MITQFVRVLPTAAYNYRALEVEINKVLSEPGTSFVDLHPIVVDRTNGCVGHEIVAVFEREGPAAAPGPATERA